MGCRAALPYTQQIRSLQEFKCFLGMSRIERRGDLGQQLDDLRRPGILVSRLDVGSARKAGPENTMDLMAFLTPPTGHPKMTANEVLSTPTP